MFKRAKLSENQGLAESLDPGEEIPSENIYGFRVPSDRKA